MENRIIFFSGGKSSFAVADWVKEKYPDDNIVLYFTDTCWEDEDLYRFINEGSDKLQLPMLTHSLGITPIQLMFEKKLVFNSMIGDCSKILKMRVAADFIKRGKKPPVERWRNKQYLKREDFTTEAILYFGIGFDEMHREEAIRKNWQPFRVEMPLIYNNIWPDKAMEKWDIKQPRLYDYGFAHNNCFHGDEKFITFDGIRTFREMVDQKVKVIGKDGYWKDAEVKYFGKQEIVELVLSKGNGKKKTIRTTADHRWFIRKNRKQRVEVLTKDLNPGDRLWSVYQRKEPNIKPSPIGIAQGIVFGDGTYPRDTRFLIRQKHIHAYGDEAKIRPCEWKVEEVRYTGKIDDVYCAVVPDGEAFVLESNILTGNCKGRCVKAGQGHYKLLRESMPDVFKEIMEQEYYINMYVSSYRYIMDTEASDQFPEHIKQQLLDELDDAYRDYFYGRTPKPKPFPHPANWLGWREPKLYSFMKKDGKPYNIRDLKWEMDEDGQIDLFDIGGCGCFVEGMESSCELPAG